MIWEDYLALISWQGYSVFLKDFIRLKNQSVQTPENLVSLVSSLETKEYLIHNKQWWKKAEKDYKHCQNKGYGLLYPGKPAYPKQFISFFDKTPILTSLGSLPSTEIYFPITFVGSRRAEELVFNWMDFYLSSLLKEKKICVVSGGARGIDQKAHQVAIRSQSPTLCFVPSGLDCFYPESLHHLKTGILDGGGAFISCFPPWATMRKSYFHIRNSLMAAWSSLVVVMQAQIRSGTMLTARKALEYGIPLCTLPGPALSALWTGNLQLIYDGAYLIRDHLDLSVLIESLKLKQPATFRNPLEQCQETEEVKIDELWHKKESE